MMPTIVIEPELEAEAGSKLLTVADVAAMPDELPSGPVKYDLENGKLVVMAPPADGHGASQLRIGSALLIQGEWKGHGQARTEVGVILRRNPDCVLTPDALFVAKGSLPIRLSPEGYHETIPDIVVEVRSKNDTMPALHRKAERYLQAGVRVVWLLDPRATSVTVCTKGEAPREIGDKDVLTAGEVIPDFAVRVADLFVA